MVSADGHLYKSISREVWCIYYSFKAYTHSIYGSTLAILYNASLRLHCKTHIASNLLPISYK